MAIRQGVEVTDSITAQQALDEAARLLRAAESSTSTKETAKQIELANTWLRLGLNYRLTS